MNDINKLTELYSNTSKHSNYQKLPTSLKRYLNEDLLQIKSKNEDERLSYILQNVAVENKTILDIGANTGFFCFELIENGARSIDAYEGNKEHADFIKYAAEFIQMDKKITVKNSYYDFTDISRNIKYDIILLLNVLHHIGDDYGDSRINLQNARKSIIESINNLSCITDILIFQLGFNWQGDRNKPLFSTGTKQEMIEFIKNGIEEKWNILKIGIPVSVEGKIVYCDLNEENIKRNDSLGEFLNRPLFILQSRM